MLSVHLDGGFYLSQPAYREMKAAGYGRFVFISSSGGMFGQPMEAHYAAAKAGLVGLANVIAIEGAEHGILANTVLPFGFSRMVTETVGDPKALEETGFLKMIQPELVVPIVAFLASRACEFTHQNYSACAGRFSRVFVGLGEGWLAEPGSNPTADDVATHLSEVSATEPFTVPGLDLRRSFRRVRKARRERLSDNELSRRYRAVMDIEQLLTTTRSARKTLDLDAGSGYRRHPRMPSGRVAGGERLQFQQTWRWLVVADPALRRKIAERVSRCLSAASRRADARRSDAGGQPGGQAHVVHRVAGRELSEGAIAGNPLLRAISAAH